MPSLGNCRVHFSKCLSPPDHHVPYFPNREIIALVAQVVPIYAVSHLFEGLAVSIMQYSLKHFYDLCVSSDDGKFKWRREAGGG